MHVFWQVMRVGKHPVAYHRRAGGTLQRLLSGTGQGQDACGEQLLLGHQFQGEGVVRRRFIPMGTDGYGG